MSYDGGRLTPIQLFLITAGFLLGTTAMFSRLGLAQEDAWVTQSLAGGLGFLYMLMYLAILGKFPGKTLVEIAQIALGKVGGGIFGLLLGLYSLHIAALTARAISELMTSGFLGTAPLPVYMTALIILSVFMARSGIEAFARTTEIAYLAGTILIPVVIFSLSIVNGLFDPSRLLPILNHDVRTMAGITLVQAAYPFGEAVILTMALGLVNNFPQGRKAALWGVFYGVTVAVMSITQELAVFGAEDTSHLIFPTLAVAKLIHVGDFLTRLEPLAMFFWITSAMTKLTLSHYAAAVSLGQIFSLSDYRPLTLPLGALLGGLSILLAKNALEVTEFQNYYGLYALPIQVLLPFALFLLVRKKRGLSQPEALDEGGGI